MSKLTEKIFLNEPKFWSKVRIGEVDECWPFVSSRQKSQSSNHKTFSIKVEGKWVNIGAHVFAYVVDRGHLPSKKRPLIRHKVCDNPPCCNPSHLRSGTH